MPTRTRTRVTRTGGFGGFAPNPTFDRDLSPEAFGVHVSQASEIHPPVLTSLPPSNPRSTLTFNTPPRTISPPLVTDASGTGLTPSTLSGNTLRSLPNDRYVRETPDIAETVPAIPSSGGRSPSFVSDPNEDWIGVEEQGGWAQSEGPELGTGFDATRTDVVAGPGGMENEPVLFEDPAQPRSGPSVTVDAGANTRRPTGSWTRPSYEMANFTGGMTIGQFLNTPLSLMSFGRTHGAQSSERVGGGDIIIGSGANRTVSHTPGDPGVSGSAQADLDAQGIAGRDIDTVSAEAEALGARETAEAQARGELPPASGPSMNPGSQYGNLNSPTGQPVYFDGRNWRPVAGSPVNVRWDPNNPNASNFKASQTTKGYLLAGGDPGRSNNMAPFASEGRMRFGSDGGVTQFGGMQIDPGKVFKIGQNKDAPTLRPTPAAQLAYNNYLRQTPEYQAWLKAKGG